MAEIDRANERQRELVRDEDERACSLFHGRSNEGEAEGGVRAAAVMICRSAELT